MKIIGLTGGIGSGKSIVCKVFEKLGIPVYNSDIEAKKLMNSTPEIKNKLISKFGKEVYLQNKLNRKFLANIIFNDEKKLKFINSLVHPIVKNHFNKWVSLQNSSYVINENAILFESNMYKNVDIIITVTAPEKIRIKRVKQRDNTNFEEVKARIKNQISDKARIKKSNFIIRNDDKELILPQILNIHKKITSE
ncbi:MAG: dephospho-CoA kinase [Bacteroidales bacterium]|nr:dephospho-CoA kinase [Bacteroidales bacterium]